MLVPGEAAAEGEGDLRLRGVPRRVGHAVAPGVEMGLLDGVLVLVHDFFPAAEMVGEDVVKAVGGAVPHMDGHHVATGADVVELACDTARGRHLMEAGHAGHGLLEGVALVEPRMPPHALRIIVEGETVAVLGDADGKVPEAVGHVAGGGRNGGAVAAPDLGDGMGTAADVGVGSRGGAGRDVARAVVGDTVHTRAVHRVGDQAVEVVVGVGLRLEGVELRARLDEPPGVVGVGELPVLCPDAVHRLFRGVGDQDIGVGGVGDIAVVDTRHHAMGVVGVLRAGAVAETGGVAPAAPGVIAQPLHGVAVDDRSQAALMVFQRVVHGSSSVVALSFFQSNVYVS